MTNTQIPGANRHMKKNPRDWQTAASLAARQAVPNKGPAPRGWMNSKPKGRAP